MQKFIHILGLRRRGQGTLRNLDHGFGMPARELSHAFHVGDGRAVAQAWPSELWLKPHAAVSRLRLYGRKAVTLR